MFNPIQQAVIDAVKHVFEQTGIDEFRKTSLFPSSLKYRIQDVDWIEHDAHLVVDGEKHYFQFGDYPSLGEALEFLFFNDKVKITC